MPNIRKLPLTVIGKTASGLLKVGNPASQSQVKQLHEAIHSRAFGFKKSNYPVP